MRNLLFPTHFVRRSGGDVEGNFLGTERKMFLTVYFCGYVFCFYTRKGTLPIMFSLRQAVLSLSYKTACRRSFSEATELHLQ